MPLTESQSSPRRLGASGVSEETRNYLREHNIESLAEQLPAKALEQVVKNKPQNPIEELPKEVEKLPKITAAELFVQCLRNEGVEHVFCLPGEETLTVVDALRKSPIKYTIVRHEAAAAWAAAAVGRMTGKLGVCLVTLGPGATNVTTPVASVFLAGSPLLVMTAQKPVRESKQAGFQIVDIVRLFQPITKYAKQIDDGELIAQHVRHAAQLAMREKQGPVLLELPEDVAETKAPQRNFPVLNDEWPMPPESQIKLAGAALRSAKRPLILLGMRASRPAARDGVRAFLDSVQIPFITTIQGKGAIDEKTHSRYLGCAAQSEGLFVHSALDHADVILTIGHDGAELPPFKMQHADLRKIIHLDYLAATPDEIYFPQIEVIGDISLGLSRLVSELQSESTTWSSGSFEPFWRVQKAAQKFFEDKRDDQGFPLNVTRIMNDVENGLPSDGIIVIDSGMFKGTFGMYFRMGPEQTLLVDNALASMASGLPTGIGAAVACPTKPVLVVCGDGGFWMGCQDLITAVRLKLNLTVLVLVDGNYGQIKYKQGLKEVEKFGVDFTNPDFCKFAEANGANGHKINSADELSKVLKDCLGGKGVNLIECPVDYDWITKGLKNMQREAGKLSEEFRHQFWAEGVIKKREEEEKKKEEEEKKDDKGAEKKKDQDKDGKESNDTDGKKEDKDSKEEGGDKDKASTKDDNNKKEQEDKDKDADKKKEKDEGKEKEGENSKDDKQKDEKASSSGNQAQSSKVEQKADKKEEKTEKKEQKEGDNKDDKGKQEKNDDKNQSKSGAAEKKGDDKGKQEKKEGESKVKKPDEKEGKKDDKKEGKEKEGKDQKGKSEKKDDKEKEKKKETTPPRADTKAFFLAGEAVTPNANLKVYNKLTQEEIATVAQATEEDLDKAIAAAVEAAPKMAALHAFQRKEILKAVVKEVSERKDEFVKVLVMEGGKPIKDAKGEVERFLATFECAAEESIRMTGEWQPMDVGQASVGMHTIVRRFPLGPVAMISPFNFPLNLVAHKVAPAIAVGCPFVLKPASSTPLSALMLGEILAKQELLPKGAWSILPCDRDSANALVEDDRLKMLTFTGSTKAGWDMKARAGKKQVVLELGGNAACIVDEFVPDLKTMMEKIVHGAFYQSGQSCISIQRLVVKKDLYEEFKGAFLEKVKGLKVGDPEDEDTFIGPLIADSEPKRLAEWVEEAKQEGAKVLCGGEVKDKVFFLPTVLENVSHKSKIYADEAFGPVVILESYEDFEEAIEIANDSKYGLQTGVYSSDVQKAFTAYEKLRVGGVVINAPPSTRVDCMPYGGSKDSGIGREGVKYAMMDMTEIKVMLLNTPVKDQK